MTKFTKSEIDAVVTNFNTAAFRKYQSHAYSSGYLSQLFAVVLDRLPTSTQEIVLKQMLEQTNQLYDEVEV